MASEQPEKLYRYRSLSTTTIESLCHDQLWFSNPAAFNDPLDCRPVVESDSDKATLRNILAELIRRRVEQETLASLNSAKLKGDQVTAHAQQVAQQTATNELNEAAYQATNPDYECGAEQAECHLLTSKIQSELLKRYERGVCCFSSAYDNPLLWSHYGDQHKGICIGYRIDKLTREPPQKMEYGGSRIIHTSLIADALLNQNTDAQQALDNSTLLRKAPPWEYEKEWRMIGDRGAHNSTLILSDITFGLRCSDAFRYTIYKAFEQRKDINFFDMWEVRGTFDLKREPVDTGEMCAYYPRNHHSIMKAFSDISALDDEEGYVSPIDKNISE